MIKPLHHYLIEPVGGEYITEKDGLIVSAGIENHKDVNRYGKLIAKPLYDDSELSIGDICIVHHNCFRSYYDMKGREKKSAEYFRENTYLIPKEKIYLYKHEGKWNSTKDFIFIKPVSYEQDFEFYIPQEKEEHVGIVKYSNSTTFLEGDKIAFKKNREYEFDIDNEKLYRMKNKDICIKFD